MKFIYNVSSVESMANHVICADALQFMKKLPDKSVDLLLTDPPYGISIASDGYVGGKRNKSKIKAKRRFYGACSWDRAIPSQAIFKEMFRVSKHQIIFGGNYFIEHLHNTPSFIVWDKDNGNSHFADCELAWTSYKTAVRKCTFRWNGFLQQNMGKLKEVRYHPTQKPIGMLKWILERYAKNVNMVLDPFAGVFSTAIACQQLGIKWISCDREMEYCRLGERRLNGTLPLLEGDVKRKTPISRHKQAQRTSDRPDA